MLTQLNTVVGKSTWYDSMAGLAALWLIPIGCTAQPCLHPHATEFELAVVLISDTLHCQYTAPTLLIQDHHGNHVGTIAQSDSSFVSFTQFCPTCGRMPLPALLLWPGRQPCRTRLADGRRGGGPSSVAPRIRNPPTGHRRDSPISSSLFSHGPPLCAVS